MQHFSKTTFLKNVLSAHLLIVITFKQNDLETRGWSQIKEVENLFKTDVFFQNPFNRNQFLVWISKEITNHITHTFKIAFQRS